MHWERWGEGDRAILFLPTWTIVHARVWKFQLPWFAQRYRVLAYDPRGNGRSDRPSDPAAYAEEEFAADAIAVLDATGTERTAIVGLSMGGQRGLLLAANHPERITAAVFIAPAVVLEEQVQLHSFVEPLDSDEGWAKYNGPYWRRDFPGFLDFFFSQCFTERHSTKQVEDCVSWGHETDAETLIATQLAPHVAGRRAASLAEAVRCPVLVIHGDQDAITPHENGRALANTTGGRLLTLAGSGHVPNARIPVKVNLLIEEHLNGSAPRAARRTRRPRAIFVSSPIGLGHAQRDLAIARELRALEPRLEIHWLAQHPVTAVLEHAGETIHPASSLLASESAHIEARTGEHELHVFQALREMDELFVANFMHFLDVVRAEHYDLWIGDEAWELDHFLHEHPELKTSPFAFLTDFVGYLPVDASEAWLTTDYNAETIGHVERHPEVRDAAIFIGEQPDLVPDSFGDGLPAICDWVPKHFTFGGYVVPESEPHERNRKRPLIVGAVGGSGVGLPLLRRIAAAFAQLGGDAELLLVCGPRIDPEAIDPVAGMTVVPYVHDLHRTLASCDLAVVHGGLSTTMELVAHQRPFVYVPLRRHFEQNGHVAYRLQRYGAPPPTPYEETTPARLAELMRVRLGSPVGYAPVAGGAAARIAESILSIA